jgi:Uma2 family endonuclease
MTREAFFDWAEAQSARFEFDGFQPVAMTGENLDHNRIALNIHMAARSRLRNGGCEAFGLDAGVATIGDTVRYPDGVVTCSRAIGTTRLVPDPVVVFEVISPASGHVDRIVKLREYAAVGSIRRYVTVESASVGLTVHSRQAGGQTWTTVPASTDDTLELPEIGTEIPLSEMYEDVDVS